MLFETGEIEAVCFPTCDQLIFNQYSLATHLFFQFCSMPSWFPEQRRWGCCAPVLPSAEPCLVPSLVVKDSCVKSILCVSKSVGSPSLCLWLLRDKCIALGMLLEQQDAHRQLWVLLPQQEWRAHLLNGFLCKDLIFCSDSLLDLVSESRCEENGLKLMVWDLTP